MQFSIFFHVVFLLYEGYFLLFLQLFFYDLPVWCSGVTSLNCRRWFDSRLYLKSKIYIVNALNHKLFFFEKKIKLLYSKCCEKLGREQLQNDMAEELDNARISYR